MIFARERIVARIHGLIPDEEALLLSKRIDFSMQGN
jgi:hypothetical protein